MNAVEFLRARGICIHCQQRQCVIRQPDSYAAHDNYWRAMSLTASRPWWTAEELVRIIERAEARERPLSRS